VMLLTAQGVPMLLMGDECGRTQQGNNNAYCHDGELTWFDWRLLETNAELFRFCREMIRFRREQSVLRSPHFDGPDAPELTWHGTQAHRPDWSGTSRVLAWQRTQVVGDHVESIYAAMNMYWEPLEFELPYPPRGTKWHLVADTVARSPEDIWEAGQEPVLADQARTSVTGRAIVLLIARADG
jgi:isoamylase